MDLPEGDWELVTDCETAGPLAEAVKAAGKEDDLPVRSHPWLPMGAIVAMRPERDWPVEWKR